MQVRRNDLWKNVPFKESFKNTFSKNSWFAQSYLCLFDSSYSDHWLIFLRLYYKPGYGAIVRKLMIEWEDGWMGVVTKAAR